MSSMKRGSAAIVGVAESDIGSVAADMSVIDLMAQGTVRALRDAGLTLSDVDGIFCATTQARTSAMSLAEYLKKPDAYVDSTIVGGSSFEIHVAHAQAAIEAGLCSVAVVAYGSTQRSAGRKNASPREFNPYETPFKPFMPSSAYAMAANRHMHEYGTTREELAEVAVAARRWAQLNPVAFDQRPLDIAGVLGAKMVSYPFTVRDCCLVTDGGGAIVLTSAARAKALKKPDAYVDSTIVGGSSFEIHVAHAQAAIEAGLCSVAVVAYGSTQRSAGRKNASPGNSTLTRHPSNPSCLPPPMPWQQIATCMNSAPRGNNWRKWRWRRGFGRSSIPLPLIKGRLISRVCLARRWCLTPSPCAIAAW